MKTPPSVGHWLTEFAACVQNRDLNRGRKLFSPDVRAFGTRAEDARGLDDLLQRQWSRVWFDTRGFRFIEDTVQALAAADNSLVCVLARWESTGVDAAGRTFARRGRCTVCLRRADDHPAGYIAEHTHFSKIPPDEL